MMITTVMVSVPEEIVKEAADMCSDDSDNSFYRIWHSGQEYKLAGMTPLYLLDREKMQLIVVAQETYGRKLH